MQISYRSCLPEDVDLAVPLIMSSGPTSFNYVFTNQIKKAEGFLRYAFQRPGGEFSYDNHIAVIYDDQMVGIGSAFDGSTSSSFLLSDFMNILRFYGLGFIPVAYRGLRTEQVIAPPKKNEVCLAHLAISPEMQGKGLGQQLIDHLMKARPCQDREYYMLDVSVENHRAKALYERLGFKTAKENKSKLKSSFGYVADHVRMTLQP